MPPDPDREIRLRVYTRVYADGLAPSDRPVYTLADRLSALPPQPPRPLTPVELQGLDRLGFQTLARQLAAGTCESCGMNKLGTGHRQMCAEPAEKRKPLPAPPPPPQPWDVLLPRRFRNAA